MHACSFLSVRERQPDIFFNVKVTMTKRKILIVSLISFLLLGNLFQYYVSQTQSKRFVSAINEIKQKADQESGRHQFDSFELKNDIQSYLRSDGLRLPSSTMVYDADTDTAIPLQGLLSRKTLLVRISQANCMVCLDVILPLLNKIGNQSIILLADYTNKRFLKKIKENHHITYPCYRIKKLFPIPMEELSVPYLFITDKDMQIECLYVPHKEMLDEVEKCFEIMTDRLSV